METFRSFAFMSGKKCTWCQFHSTKDRESSNEREKPTGISIICTIRDITANTTSMLTVDMSLEFQTAPTTQPKNGERLKICLKTLKDGSCVKILKRHKHSDIYRNFSFLPCVEIISKTINSIAGLRMTRKLLVHLKKELSLC